MAWGTGHFVTRSSRHTPNLCDEMTFHVTPVKLDCDEMTSFVGTFFFTNSNKDWRHATTFLCQFTNVNLFKDFLEKECYNKLTNKERQSADMQTSAICPWIRNAYLERDWRNSLLLKMLYNLELNSGELKRCKYIEQPGVYPLEKLFLFFVMC